MRRLYSFTLTIPGGANQSTAFDLRGYRPVALLLPFGWTPAPVSFGVQLAGGGLNHLCASSGAQIVMNPPAINCHCLLDGWFATAESLVVFSGTQAAPVNQAAQRLLTLICEAESP